MSSFTVLVLCIQACLIQNVFSQACLGAYAPAITPACGSPLLAGAYGFNGLAATGLAYDNLAYPAIGYAGAFPAAGYGAGFAAYGGAGEGNVAVAGELPVAGNTAVAGQVPIMGAVSFGGAVPAAGAVSISGKCACGCGTPYDYLY